MDNAMSFYGSPLSPRGMGPLIRLSLHCGVEPWFIPVSEPWRNGVVEKFNDHYQAKFLRKVVMHTLEELESGSLDFEQRHNGSYPKGLRRYSKLGGRTPNGALSSMNRKLRFPKTDDVPKHYGKKPEAGFYHLVRLVRSDLKLNVFGELFIAPPETEHEYVVATIDVEREKLKIYLDKKQIEEYDYKLR